MPEIQLTLSKTETFGTGTKFPSYREFNKESLRAAPDFPMRPIHFDWPFPPFCIFFWLHFPKWKTCPQRWMRHQPAIKYSYCIINN